MHHAKIVYTFEKYFFILLSVPTLNLFMSLQAYFIGCLFLRRWLDLLERRPFNVQALKDAGSDPTAVIDYCNWIGP